MAKAQIKTGSFQPALLGRWDRLKLRDAEKEEEQSIVVGRARWHVWAVQAPSGAHPQPLGDRGSGQADRSGWAAWGKHLPCRGTESHRLQAPAALRKWQRHPSTVRLKPQAERGNATIPASTESKPHPGEGREVHWESSAVEKDKEARTRNCDAHNGQDGFFCGLQLSELCVHPRAEASSKIRSKTNRGWHCHQCPSLHRRSQAAWNKPEQPPSLQMAHIEKKRQIYQYLQTAKSGTQGCQKKTSKKWVKLIIINSELLNYWIQ